MKKAQLFMIVILVLLSISSLPSFGAFPVKAAAADSLSFNMAPAASNFPANKNEGHTPTGKKKIWCAIVSFSAGLLGIFPLAIVFGIMSLRRHEGLKGLAIAGIILGVVDIILAILLAILFFAIFL